ncbi:MAG TPA: rhomboid family intramembrane serine protease [Chitinophagaceae bacterium]|jgi:membrane associated rhomboid family serine protease|nr:rhomboid family intramembrane serine protease [Chitinophagaceae bacterium]
MRPFSITPVVKNLLIVNVLVFLAQLVLQAQIPVTRLLTLWPVGHPYYGPYQLITYMFVHDPRVLFHLLFNMISLWVFGPRLEAGWGPQRFLFFYLSCGLGAALVHMAMGLAMGGIAPVLGASGAVMGLVIASAYLWPNTEMLIFPIPIPVTLKWLAVGYVVLDLYNGFRGGTGVAHFAHLGGALTGFIIVLIWNRTNRRNFY